MGKENNIGSVAISVIFFFQSPKQAMKGVNTMAEDMAQTPQPIMLPEDPTKVINPVMPPEDPTKVINPVMPPEDPTKVINPVMPPEATT